MYDGDLDFGYQNEIPIDEENIVSILGGLFEYSRRNGDFGFGDINNIYTSDTSQSRSREMLGQVVYKDQRVDSLLFEGNVRVSLYQINPWVIVARYVLGGASIIITPLIASTLSTFGERLGNDLYKLAKAKFLDYRNREDLEYC